MKQKTNSRKKLKSWAWFLIAEALIFLIAGLAPLLIGEIPIPDLAISFGVSIFLNLWLSWNLNQEEKQGPISGGAIDESKI